MQPYDSEVGRSPLPTSPVVEQVPRGDGPSARSMGELFSDFLEQARRLLRAEVALLKAELREETKTVASAGAMVGVGGVLLFIGGIATMLFLTVVLALVMPLWLSTLLVAAAFLAAGAGLVSVSLKRFKQVHAPNQTIQTLKEDGRWASRTFQSVKSRMHGHA